MEPYPKSWAEKFAAELTVEGERVPFERVLAHHEASPHVGPHVAQHGLSPRARWRAACRLRSDISGSITGQLRQIDARSRNAQNN
jgi:hypothetical protein